MDPLNENYVFDFKKELVEYCKSDVDILRRPMLNFRDDFIKIANIDPLPYITIASVCMAVYRSKLMPENTIGVIKNTPKKRLVRRQFSGCGGIRKRKTNISSML